MKMREERKKRECWKINTGEEAGAKQGMERVTVTGIRVGRTSPNLVILLALSFSRSTYQ